MTEMTLKDLERRCEETKGLAKTFWNPDFGFLRERCERLNIEPTIAKVSGPRVRNGTYGGEVHTYRVRVGGAFVIVVDLLPWLGFDPIRSCIICRMDQSNPTSNRGHKLDEKDYCVVCREDADRMHEEIARRIQEKRMAK